MKQPVCWDGDSHSESHSNRCEELRLHPRWRMLIAYAVRQERIVNMFALFFQGLNNPHPKIVVSVRK